MVLSRDTVPNSGVLFTIADIAFLSARVEDYVRPPVGFIVAIVLSISEHLKKYYYDAYVENDKPISNYANHDQIWRFLL